MAKHAGARSTQSSIAPSSSASQGEAQLALSPPCVPAFSQSLEAQSAPLVAKVWDRYYDSYDAYLQAVKGIQVCEYESATSSDVSASSQSVGGSSRGRSASRRARRKRLAQRFRDGLISSDSSISLRDKKSQECAEDSADLDTGCCYLKIVLEGSRALERVRCGIRPTVDAVLNTPWRNIDKTALYSTKVSCVEEGVFHIGDCGVSLLDALTKASKEYEFSDKTLGAVLRSRSCSLTMDIILMELRLSSVLGTSSLRGFVDGLCESDQSDVSFSSSASDDYAVRRELPFYDSVAIRDGRHLPIPQVSLSSSTGDSFRCVKGRWFTYRRNKQSVDVDIRPMTTLAYEKYFNETPFDSLEVSLYHVQLPESAVMDEISAARSTADGMHEYNSARVKVSQVATRQLAAYSLTARQLVKFDRVQFPVSDKQHARKLVTSSYIVVRLYAVSGTEKRLLMVQPSFPAWVRGRSRATYVGNDYPHMGDVEYRQYISHLRSLYIKYNSVDYSDNTPTLDMFMRTPRFQHLQSGFIEDGYCYLMVIKPEMRQTCKDELGMWPTVDDVSAVASSWLDVGRLSDVYLDTTDSQRYFVTTNETDCTYLEFLVSKVQQLRISKLSSEVRVG